MYLNQERTVAIATLLETGEIWSRRLAETEPRCHVELPKSAKCIVTMDCHGEITWKGKLPRLAFAFDGDELKAVRDPLAIAATILEGGDLELPEKRVFLSGFAPVEAIASWIDKASMKSIKRTLKASPELVQPVDRALTANAAT